MTKPLHVTAKEASYLVMAVQGFTNIVAARYNRPHWPKRVDVLFTKILALSEEFDMPARKKATK
jgi:hypothetical protein